MWLLVDSTFKPKNKSRWCTQDKKTIQHLFGCPRLCFNATGRVRWGGGERLQDPVWQTSQWALTVIIAPRLSAFTRNAKSARNLSFKRNPGKGISGGDGLPCAQHKGWSQSIRQHAGLIHYTQRYWKYIEIKSLFSRSPARLCERHHSPLWESILRLSQISWKQFRPGINRKMARMGRAQLTLEHPITRIYFWSPGMWNRSDTINCLFAPFQST